MVKKLLSIDPNVKGAISEFFDKSHFSDSFDVPAGCVMVRDYISHIEVNDNIGSISCQYGDILHQS